MKLPRLPFAAAAVAALAAFAAGPALAASDPFPAWGDAPAVELREFILEFDAALEEADARFDAIQLAGAGMVSPKDGCHKATHNGQRERHWHIEGTKDRGGPCVRVDGETHQFGKNAICARARVALDEDREYDDWVRRKNARALVVCVQNLPDGG